jgi:hypothetical protein
MNGYFNKRMSAFRWTWMLKGGMMDECKVQSHGHFTESRIDCHTSPQIKNGCICVYNYRVY